MNLELVDRIYRCSSSADIIIHEVADVEIAQFARNLTSLEKSAAAIQSDDHLKPIFRLFRRIRFVLASTPIPPQHSTLQLDAGLHSIHQMLPALRPGFPELIDQASALATRVEALFGMEVHPFERKLREIEVESPFGEGACVVVKDSKLAESTAAYFRFGDRCPKLHVVTPFELRDAEPCCRIIVLGSPRWLVDDGFDFIFQAPRAERIDVISFAWVGNQLKIESAFPKTVTTQSHPGIRVARELQRELDVPGEIEAAQLLPAFNVEEFKQQIAVHSEDPEHEDQEDLVDATVALLAGRKAVFLDRSDGAKSYTIDLRESPNAHEDEEAFLVRELNCEIEEGKFLLLRTEGGGDLIPVVAEKILGANAQNCSEIQQQWKGLLNWYVKRHGREVTAERLSRLGAFAARPVNIGNWTRTRNIRPGADEDFTAVLKLVGLESDAARFFENGSVILNARKRAGTHIRKLLMAEVRSSNLGQLKERGVMTFQLSGLGAGGSMTAFRIEKLLLGIHHIPYAKASQPFPVSDDLWL